MSKFEPGPLIELPVHDEPLDVHSELEIAARIAMGTIAAVAAAYREDIPTTRIDSSAVELCKEQ